MTDYVFEPAKQVSLTVKGEGACFPVRRIYCIGKNYTDHVVEMGGDASRSEPIFFTKAAETIVPDGGVMSYPPGTDNLHYEVELVVAMGPDGVWGYGVGIDMTRRDIQAKAKSKGGPWDRAKSFAESAPCSDLIRAEGVDLAGRELVLRKNGEVVQSTTFDKMIWSVDEIIARLSQDMDLQAGDLIYTGTPAGVGPVVPGDSLHAEVTDLISLKITIGARA